MVNGGGGETLKVVEVQTTLLQEHLRRRSGQATKEAGVLQLELEAEALQLKLEAEALQLKLEVGVVQDFGRAVLPQAVATT